jgi:hypothetical protein
MILSPPYKEYSIPAARRITVPPTSHLKGRWAVLQSKPNETDNLFGLYGLDRPLETGIGLRNMLEGEQQAETV